jgi:nicotinate-nucleotide adenylyltransferase
MGGGFNPVHFGHLRAAEEMSSHFRLFPTYFIPTAIPPHKGGLSMAPFEDRFRMVELAIKGREGFIASDLESRLPSPSYTVNTLKALSKELHPDDLMFFLVGFDSFRQIGGWHKHKELFKLSSFIVNIRPRNQGSDSVGSRASLAELLTKIFGEKPAWDPASGAYLPQDHRPVYYFEGSRLAISSTDIRKRLGEGESVRYLVPETVLDYLKERGTYSGTRG